jgi:hypothetical protein
LRKSRREKPGLIRFFICCSVRLQSIAMIATSKGNSRLGGKRAQAAYSGSTRMSLNAAKHECHSNTTATNLAFSGTLQ